MQVPVLYDLIGEISVTQFLLLDILVLTVVYYLYATRHHGVWEKLGVPGPKPWPIIDHTLELRKSPGGTLQKWFARYGKTFGAYGLLPHKAVLFIKDLELVKQVLVKDFDNFADRTHSRKTVSSVKHALNNLVGDSWKRTRTVTSPMFTGARMKAILRQVSASAETVTQLTKQKSSKGELIPLKLLASKFSTEVIARIAFGVETHAVSEQETEFAYYARNLIKFDSKFLSFLDKIYQYFPELDAILRFFHINTDFISHQADNYFVSILNSTIKDRKKTRNSSNNDKPRDYLDMLLSAEVGDDDPRLKNSESKTMNHDEIVGNSTILILAGVDTVSTTFQSLLYCLALYPDIQDKLVAEIDSIFPRGTEVDYDQLKDLKYAEQVIHECLRLFPQISTIMRRAAETKTYGSITIPRDTYVHIPIGDIMKDPENWPEPEKFDPDRFSTENKAGRDPLAFLPFGYGPRICLGMRLAMTELKVILVYLLRDVKFTLSDRTQPKKGEKLVMKQLGIVLLRPSKPIELEAVLRI